MLSTGKLKGIVPDAVLAQIDPIAVKFNITNDLRLAHFLSQCSHESGSFKVIKENLFYSAEGLLKIFPKYFNATTAPLYAKQPVKIASKVYANRMGNGDEASGDGYKFCGKGYIQLTGRNNYKAFSSYIGDDCVTYPDLIATKYPLASAAYFFNVNNLWGICDRGKDVDTVTALTKRINGGTIGIDDRLKIFNQYVGLLGL